MPMTNFQSLGGRLRGVTSRAMARRGSLELTDREPTTVPNVSVVRASGFGRLFQWTSNTDDSVDLNALTATGARVSFLRVLPGVERPYLIRHRRDEVTYVVAEGQGQFMVDGQVIDVSAGTILRVSPQATRAWRNTSCEDLCLIVIQARARRFALGRRQDAEGLTTPDPWPR